MTEEYNLQTKSRENERAKIIRQNEQIPAVVYGNGFSNLKISINAKEFNKLFEVAGESSLINLEIDGSSIKVLVHDHQINPITGEITHIDFYKVNMKEKIKTEIPLKEIGEAPAVVDLEGTLVTNRDNVEVECLPSDLIHEIEVDITVLKTFDDVVHVSDLKIPSGIEVITDAEEVVFSVLPPRSEEDLAELEEKPEEDVEAVEVEGEKKDEEASAEDESKNTSSNSDKK